MKTIQEIEKEYEVNCLEEITLFEIKFPNGKIEYAMYPLIEFEENEYNQVVDFILKNGGKVSKKKKSFFSIIYLPIRRFLFKTKLIPGKDGFDY